MQVDDAWHDRLGWAFDLIAHDASERHRAHARLVETRRLCDEALDHYNQVFYEPDHPERRHRLATWLQARRDTLPDALWESIDPMSLAAWAGLPYALLYLRWEALFPDEWFAYAKGWGTKRGLLSLFTRASNDVPDTVVDQLIDLVVLAARREHRCKDVGYARLARALDRPQLRARLAAIADQPIEPARLRAGYLLWLLDLPDAPQPKKSQWLSWLSSQVRQPS
jgi:hypothetical protein